MRAQAHVFRRLRKGRLEESKTYQALQQLDQLDKRIARAKLPRRAEMMLLNVTHQIRAQTEQLARVNTAVQNGSLRPGRVFQLVVASYLNTHGYHGMPPQLRKKLIGHPGIKLKIDYVGMHFTIPKDLYEDAQSLFRSEEGFAGLSFGLAGLMIPLKKEHVDFDSIPVSLSIEGYSPNLRQTKDHEKWHDFESYRPKYKSYGLHAMNKKPIHEVLQLFDGWWRVELSASIVGGQTIAGKKGIMDSSFAERMQWYAGKIVSLLQSQGRPESEVQQVRAMENKYRAILREVGRIQFEDPLHVGKGTTHSDSTINRLILAGIVSYSPSSQIISRLGILSALASVK